MGRAYLRVDPAMFEHKVIQQEYPPLAYAAYSAILCLADSQPIRGRFRDERVLRALLGPLGRQVPFLQSKGDIIPAASHKRCKDCPDGHGSNGQVYVDGWDEWQEGDWQVKERMARVHAKKRNGLHGPDRSAAVLAESGASDAIGGTARPNNVYTAFLQLVSKEPDEKEHKWLDDLCHDFGRSAVIDVMFNDPTPKKMGLLGRVSRVMRQ